MADCDLITGCKFFNDQLHDVPDMVLEGYKLQYCRTDNSRCARLAIATSFGREVVPINMGPHETERAEKVLFELGHPDPSSCFK